MGSLLSFGCSVGMWDSLRRASTIRWALDLLGAIEVAASQRGRGAEGEARERERPTLMVLTTARRARLSLSQMPARTTGQIKRDGRHRAQEAAGMTSNCWGLLHQADRRWPWVDAFAVS